MFNNPLEGWRPLSKETRRPILTSKCLEKKEQVMWERIGFQKGVFFSQIRLLLLSIWLWASLLGMHSESIGIWWNLVWLVESGDRHLWVMLVRALFQSSLWLGYTPKKPTATWKWGFLEEIPYSEMESWSLFPLISRCFIMWKISRFVAYFFGFGIGQAQLGDGNTKSTPNLQYPNSEAARLILPPQWS